MKIRNIKWGEQYEFETVEELLTAIHECGYTEVEELVEGIDYEIVSEKYRVISGEGEQGTINTPVETLAEAKAEVKTEIGTGDRWARIEVNYSADLDDDQWQRLEN